MSKYRLLTVGIAIAVTFWTFAAAWAAPSDDPCKQVRQACLKAGFTQGTSKQGTGLKVDCIEPLIKGETKAKAATLPLPNLPEDTLKACRDQQAATTTSPGSTPADATPTQPVPLPTGAKPGPNIVFILADDFSMNLISNRGDLLQRSMPNLKKMIDEGTAFDHYFVTDSLCCPSRTSIFTGKLPHDSGVFTNSMPWGGYGGFMQHGNAPQTFAVALHQAGYRTAMLGKYLNGYEPNLNGAPPGWSEWDVDGDQGYGEVNYPLNENGKLVHHTDYLTDAISKLGRNFIEASGKTPFFIELATFAPHAPYIPPERYKSDFKDVSYERTAAYGAKPDATASEWLKLIPPLVAGDETRMEEAFRNRVRSDKAIDDMIGDVRDLLSKMGVAQNTYVIFSSDNGYHMGEYSLRPGKMTPLDTDINVPLVIIGPGVPAGKTVAAIAENIDLCPTFTAIAGSPGPTVPDGHSLLPLLIPDAAATTDWRHMALIEHHHPGPDKTDPDLPEPSSGNPPSYEAIRMADAMYVEYSDTKGEIGYYDLKADPFELHNIAGDLSKDSLAKFHTTLMANANCKGAESCWKAQSMPTP